MEWPDTKTTTEWVEEQLGVTFARPDIEMKELGKKTFEPKLYDKKKVDALYEAELVRIRKVVAGWLKE